MTVTVLTNGPMATVGNVPATVVVVDHAGPQTAVTGGPVIVLSPVGLQGPAGTDTGAAGLVVHLADLTPHAAYDDLPSLTILFENGLI